MKVTEVKTAFAEYAAYQDGLNISYAVSEALVTTLSNWVGELTFSALCVSVTTPVTACELIDALHELHGKSLPAYVAVNLLAEHGACKWADPRIAVTHAVADTQPQAVRVIH